LLEQAKSLGEHSFPVFKEFESKIEPGSDSTASKSLRDFKFYDM